MAKFKKASRIAEAFTEALELPSGLLGGGSHIELNAGREAIIDGKCTVLEYDDCMIRINTGSGIICFMGKNLEIKSLCADSAVIIGCFSSLEFSN